MPKSKTAATEVLALRQELQALRAARDELAEPVTAAEPTGAGVDLEVNVDVDWSEVRALANELAEEAGRLARQRPVVGIVAAFVLGVVVGRLALR